MSENERQYMRSSFPNPRFNKFCAIFITNQISAALVILLNLCYRCDNRQNKIGNVCVLVAEPSLTNPNQFSSDTPFADPWEGILIPCFGGEEGASSSINIMIGGALNILIGQVLLALALHRQRTE